MSAFANLPTLAEISATRRATPKAELATRLDTKVAHDKDDAKLLREWARYVRLRDQGKCRVCGVQTIQTLELVPNRCEVHHVVSRTCVVTRYDVRNGVVLCATHHQAVTRHELFPVGAAADMFTVGRTARKFLNASAASFRFVRKRPTR